MIRAVLFYEDEDDLVQTEDVWAVSLDDADDYFKSFLDQHLGTFIHITYYNVEDETVTFKVGNL